MRMQAASLIAGREIITDLTTGVATDVSPDSAYGVEHFIRELQECQQFLLAAHYEERNKVSALGLYEWAWDGMVYHGMGGEAPQMPVPLHVVRTLPPRDAIKTVTNALALPLAVAERRLKAMTEASEPAPEKAGEAIGADVEAQATIRAMEMVGGACDEVSLLVIGVASETQKSVEEKMKAILAIDRRYAGYNSPQWARLLHVSTSAIRQTPLWKDQKNWRGRL